MPHTAHFSATILKDLVSLSLFEGVETDVLREMSVSAQNLQYAKGEVIIPLGASVLRSSVILSGWCGASKGNAEGQESLLELFCRGDFLFETIVGLQGDISPMNLISLTPVQLLSFSPGAIRLAEERSPVFLANMLAASIRRNQILRDHIEQLTLHSAEQRVGRFLLELRLMSSNEDNCIPLPFEKSQIASYLGIKPETLSRVFQTLRKKGFVIGRSSIATPHQEALCCWCDASSMAFCPFADAKDCPLRKKGVKT